MGWRFGPLAVATGIKEKELQIRGRVLIEGTL